MKFRASRYYVLLGGIIVFGIALRNIGLHWLSCVAPNPYFTFHPDAYRAIRAITEWNFSIPDGYLLGMTTHLYLVNRQLIPAPSTCCYYRSARSAGRRPPQDNVKDLSHI
jgi:hypothetical protein